VSVARALLLATALASGCASSKPKLVDFSETPRDYRSKDYPDVYQRWTRHELVLHEVDVALDVWATLKSWDFREAFIEHYADIYSISDADRLALRSSELQQVHNGYEFHVAAQSASSRWNDLEKPNSAWRVSLVDAVGHELLAEKIKVERLPEAFATEFFPDNTARLPDVGAPNAFTKTYTIRFVVPAQTDFGGPKSGSITLRLASPIGRLDLTWRAS
jgi:hypothetical protein